MAKDKLKVGIIGAGIGGLATALRLSAKAGFEVDVFEANSYPGGKLSEFRLGEYRFDAGPSLFTMPQYVDELYQLARPTNIPPLPYQKMDTVCHYFWEDGTRIDAAASPDAFAREVEEKLKVPGSVVLQKLEDSARKYQLTGDTFLHKSLHHLNTWTTSSVAKALLQLPRLNIFRSMHQDNRKRLKHPKLVQLFNRFATYNGSDPYRATALLNMIPHFEHGIGTYFPEGGMFAITDHIYKLGKEKGVRYHFDSPVEKILVKDGRARGLLVNGKEKAFDLVVSNMDVFFTYRNLLADQKAPERMLRQEKSTSALIFYWGIGKQFSELDLHNIFFSEDYQAEFEHLRQGKIYEDPTVYINIGSKYAPEDAPAHGENWFTMVNVPYDSGQDWDKLIAQTRNRVLKKLSRMLGTDIEPLIEVEDLLEPRSIQRKTSSHLGALYGTASNSQMAAFLRHPNFSRRIDDLYFCGGSVHPGGGIPLCLLSAKIVEQEIKRTHGG
ncbi:MAG: phytoene desaturase [Bacteroidetes bacterium]|nr:phytoene desaturase [Bacteroidota bacterium]